MFFRCQAAKLRHRGGWAWSFDLLAMRRTQQRSMELLRAAFLEFWRRSSCRLMGSYRLARTAQRTLRNLSPKARWFSGWRSREFQLGLTLQVKGSPKAKARRERKATILEKERASLKERMAKAKARTSRERMARANLRARERASLARTLLAHVRPCPC